MSSEIKDVKLEDLPPPDKLLSVEDLPSPAELGYAPESTPGKLESLARGAEQGLLFNFGDELNAALESATSDKTYNQAVQESRKKFEQAGESNPYTSMAGTVLGSLIPGGLIAKGLGGGARLLQAALPAAEESGVAANAASKIAELIKAGSLGQGGIPALAATGAATGAVEGGLQGAGATEDANKIVNNLPSDIALGGAVGGAGGVAAGLLGKLVNATKASDIFTAGREGTNLFSKDVVEGLGKDARSALLDVSKGAKEEIGQAGQSIQNALAATPATSVQTELDAFKQAADQVDTLKPYVNKVGRLLKDKETDPNALYQAYRYVRDSAHDIGISPMPDADKSEKMQLLNDLKNQIISKLDESSQQAVASNPNAKSLSEARSQYAKLINVVERFAPGAKDKSSLDAETFSKVERGLQNLLTKSESDTTGGLITKAELNEVRDALGQASPELAKKFEAAKAPIETLALRKQAIATGNILKTTTGAGAHLAGLGVGKIESAVGNTVSKIPTVGDLFKPEVAEKVSNLSPTLGNMMKRLQDETTSESKRRAYQNILLNNPIVRKALSQDTDK